MTNQTNPLETCGRRGSGGCAPANEDRLEFPAAVVVVSHPSGKAVQLQPFAVSETRQ